VIFFAARSRGTRRNIGVPYTAAAEDRSCDSETNEADEDNGKEEFADVGQWLRGQICNGADRRSGDDDEDNGRKGDKVEDGLGRGEDAGGKARKSRGRMLGDCWS